MKKLTFLEQVDAQVDEHAVGQVDDRPINWERAFMFLMAMTCQGFISSKDMEHRVAAMQKVDPRVANRMVAFFNTTRSNWMQDFMG
jgi:hypothetical protein